MIIFSNMRYGMYYYVVKFQLKTPPMHGEINRQIVLGGNLNQRASLRGKMNQTIVLEGYPDFSYS